MLYLIAVDTRGTARASMLWRDDVEGALVSVGEHPTSEMRLSGAGFATCDVWRQSDVWCVRRPDGSVTPVIDGDAIPVGRWTLITLLGGDNAEGSARVEVRAFESYSYDDEHGNRCRPTFELDGQQIADIPDELPLLLGGNACCAIRLPWTREGVSAVIRRERRTTRCYLLAGTTLIRNGAPVKGRIVLNDGDVLSLADAPPIRYADADEAIDRLLGVLRGDDPLPEPEERPRATSAAERIGAVVGFRRHAYLSVWEAALACGAAAALIGQCAVTIARW